MPPLPRPRLLPLNLINRRNDPPPHRRTVHMTRGTDWLSKLLKDRDYCNETRLWCKRSD